MLKQRGLTLVELMITIAIAAILITIGGPGISSILQQNRIVADINDLSAIARIARFTAVDQSTPVTLCPTSDYTTCTTDWSKSKMAFIDDNSNGKHESAEMMLGTTEKINSNNTLSGISGTLTFQADGSISSAATIKICPQSGDVKQASALILSLFGRIAVANDSDGDGIKEDGNGSNLAC